MEVNPKEALKEIEKIIALTPAKKMDEWLDAYRQYEKETKEPITLFEWILLKNKNA
ncbi:hypothetical protein [Aneurinibacillus danicus]|jgi:hypothetical protein|uniref:Uncharacterized protein n=1 Tax=Aneurinibacillus danicus TaxID=267746 RepID=A0A511VCZ5_9BACL|nr:hypothetical protein [Aneurinibacillus danicus]GEN36757.1 hypothetical protein ADA01nite_42170 [Aneurinibacillus danicus]